MSEQAADEAAQYFDDGGGSNIEISETYDWRDELDPNEEHEFGGLEESNLPWQQYHRTKKKIADPNKMGHRKPNFAPLRTPTASKDPRTVVIDGVPRNWTQSSFLRSFAEAYSYVEIRSVRRLPLGGWLLRLSSAEAVERLIGEPAKTLKNENDGLVNSLHIHRIGERTPHAIDKIEKISRQLFSTIDPRSLDCVVELDLPQQDMIDEGVQKKTLDELIEEERTSEKSLLLRAISTKIDNNLSIEEPHKIIALNLRGAFLIEFVNSKDADNYLEKGLPFRVLGCLLKCRRNVADVRTSTHFCKKCCNVGHLDIACKRIQMCRVCGEKGHSSKGAKCPKQLVHHQADAQNPSLFCVFCHKHCGHLAGATSCRPTIQAKRMALRPQQVPVTLPRVAETISTAKKPNPTTQKRWELPTPTQAEISQFQQIASNSQLPDSVARLIAQMIASQESIARQLAEQQAQLRMLMTTLLPSVIQQKPPQAAKEKVVVSSEGFPPLARETRPPPLPPPNTSIPSSTSAKQSKTVRSSTKKPINKVPIFKVGNIAQLHTHRVAKLGEEATQQMAIDNPSKKRSFEKEDGIVTEESRNPSLRQRPVSILQKPRESNSTTPTPASTK